MIFDSYHNSLYQDLVDQAQENYSQNYWSFYSHGLCPVEESKKSLPYESQIELFAEKVREADCVVVGGASGLSAAGGEDFYYEDNASYRKYFGKYAEKYGFKGAFAGMMYNYKSAGERWGYLVTFLHTTLNAEVRKPYLDLDAILRGKDFFVITTNQDTHFQLNGFDVNSIFEAEGNFDGMETRSTEWKAQFERFRKFVSENADKNLLVMELGVGPRNQYLKTPLINLLLQNPKWKYLALNLEKDIVIPRGLEERSLALAGDIAENLDKLLRHLK